MLKRLVAALVIVTLSAGFAPAPKPKPKAKSKEDRALEELQGTWTLDSYELGGRKINLLGRQTTTTVKVTKNEWTIEYGGGGFGGAVPAPVKYTIKLDASKSPFWIDLTPQKGQNNVTMIGIFEVQGNTLKHSYASSFAGRGGIQATRPTSFNDPNNRSYVMIYKRTGKK